MERPNQKMQGDPGTSLWLKKSVNRRSHLAGGGGCLLSRCKITDIRTLAEALHIPSGLGSPASVISVNDQIPALTTL